MLSKETPGIIIWRPQRLIFCDLQKHFENSGLVLIGMQNVNTNTSAKQ